MDEVNGIEIGVIFDLDRQKPFRLLRITIDDYDVFCVQNPETKNCIAPNGDEVEFGIFYPDIQTCMNIFIGSKIIRFCYDPREPIWYEFVPEQTRKQQTSSLYETPFSIN